MLRAAAVGCLSAVLVALAFEMLHDFGGNRPVRVAILIALGLLSVLLLLAEKKPSTG
jgi:hypothetical protein